MGLRMTRIRARAWHLAAHPACAVTGLQHDGFPQSLVIRGPRRGDLVFVLNGPTDQGIDRLDERRAQRRQAVLDSYRYGRVGGALDDAVAFEMAQRHREHALTDVGQRASDVHEPPGPAVQEGNDEHRPLVADAVEDVAHLPADGLTELVPRSGYFFRTKCG